MKTRKNMHSGFVALTLSAAVLASCGKEATDSPGTPAGALTPLRVTASVEKATRASDAQWDYGDQIGISGSSGSLTYANVPYHCKDAAAGSFVPLGFEKVYFGAETGDFSAYYPYRENADITDGKIAVDVREQRVSRVCDFLYAPRTQALKRTGNVDFTFSHRMSKVVLHMLPGTGFHWLELFYDAYRVELCSLHATGTFEPATGATAVTGVPEILTFRHKENITADSEWNGTTTNVVYSILLFPETVTGGVELKVVDVKSDTPYTALLKSGTDGNLTLEPGKVYDYTVTVNKTGLVLSGVTITDWVPGEVPNGGEVDATL